MDRTVIDEIAAERKRQIEQEGWTDSHDDEHDGGQLATAAACYALSSGVRDFLGRRMSGGILAIWPWSTEWWKPKDRRRDLVRAAALIVAEIERLDRLPALSQQRLREP